MLYLLGECKLCDYEFVVLPNFDQCLGIGVDPEGQMQVGQVKRTLKMEL